MTEFQQFSDEIISKLNGNKDSQTAAFNFHTKYKKFAMRLTHQRISAFPTLFFFFNTCTYRNYQICAKKIHFNLKFQLNLR